MGRHLAFVLFLLTVVGSWTLRSRPIEPVPVLDDEDTSVVIAALDPDAAPRSLEELRARIAQVLARDGVPGVGLALVDRDGVIWTGGVGVRKIDGPPVDADTVFRVASITKSFVGLGVMRLVEQGKLDLDRPLAEYLPEIAIENRWHDVAPVTLAHVLEHTAGFDDMRFNETFIADETISPGAALAINPHSRIVRWRPGTRFSYSNVGYSVAARAIEVATGEPFDVWLHREVLQPLGMHEADFQRTKSLADRLATGHRDSGRAVRFVPITHRAAGALLASPRDLAGLVHFWLRRGDGFAPIVSDAGLARIERTGSQPYPARDVGYGLGNYGDVAHPVRARGHNGGLPGFSSCLRYFPEIGVGYVVLLDANSAPALASIRRLVFAYLTRDRVLPPLPEVPDIEPVALDAHAFAFASPRHELLGFIDRVLVGWRVEVDRSGARLESLAGTRSQYVPTSDGGFRHRHESGTSLRFARNPDDVPVLLAHGTYGEATWWWFAKLRTWALAGAVVLLGVAPLFATGVIGAAVLRRRSVPALGLVAWPAIAGLAFDLIPQCIAMARVHGGLARAHPWTIAICVTTLVFALASAASMAAAVRWSLRSDRPPLRYRLLPSLAAIAAFGMTLWLGAHGIIGLRTWAW